jgi:threonine/homoserine/homoserine lactone efflux protein
VSALFGIFFSSFAVAFSGAAAPGPVLSLTIAESLRRGFRAGPLIILGHGILEAFLLLFFLLGLSNILSHPVIPPVLGLFGGMFLVAMSVGMFLNLGKNGGGSIEAATAGLHEKTVGSSARSSFRRNPVVLGALTSLANPYWFIWWATIGFTYTKISVSLGTWGVVFFFSGHILADLAWYSGVSFLFSRGKRCLSGAVYRGIIGCCALLLLVFGVYFITWSIGSSVPGSDFSMR